jgi:hypothetical protein
LAAIGFFDIGQEAYTLAARCSASVPSWTTAEGERWTDRGYRVAQHSLKGEAFRLFLPLQQRSQRDRGEDEAGRAERVGSDQGERHTSSAGDTAKHHRQHCRAQQSQNSVQDSLHTGNGTTRRSIRLAWFLRGGLLALQICSKKDRFINSQRRELYVKSRKSDRAAGRANHRKLSCTEAPSERRSSSPIRASIPAICKHAWAIAIFRTRRARGAGAGSVLRILAGLRIIACGPAGSRYIARIDGVVRATLIAYSEI